MYIYMYICIYIYTCLYVCMCIGYKFNAHAKDKGKKQIPTRTKIGEVVRLM